MPPKRSSEKEEEEDWQPAAVKAVPKFVCRPLGEPVREKGDRRRFPEVLFVFKTGAKEGFQLNVGNYLVAPSKPPSRGKRTPDMVGEVRAIFEGPRGDMSVQIRKFMRPEEWSAKRQGASAVDRPPAWELVRTGELLELPSALVAAGRRAEVLSEESLRERQQHGLVPGLGDYVFSCAQEAIFQPGGLQLLWPLKAGDLAPSQGEPELQDAYAPRAEAAPRAESPSRKPRCSRSDPETPKRWKRLRPEHSDTRELPPAKRPCSSGIAGALEKAADALRPCVGGALLCRDVERKEIITRLRGAIREGGSTQVLYVSGMPGTGKTASIMEALKRLRAEKDTPDFASVEINAMRLGDPRAIFKEIRRQLRQKGLLGQGAVGEAAYEEVKEFFTHRPGGKVVLLFIDEIDQLHTHRQVVLYCLFHLLLLPHPGLVVAAISNTLDLPERLLPKIASRVRCARVDFLSYTKSQIRAILTHRLRSGGALDAFHEDALNLCAAKVCHEHGDIRKALQVCRYAANARLTDTEKPGPVELKHIQAATKELLRPNPVPEYLGGLNDRTRVFLVAAVVEQRRKPGEPVPYPRIERRYERLLQRYRDGLQVQHDEARTIAQRLEALAILTLVPEAQAISAMVSKASVSGGPFYGFHGTMDEDGIAKVLITLCGDQDKLADALQE